MMKALAYFDLQSPTMFRPTLCKLREYADHEYAASIIAGVITFLLLALLVAVFTVSSEFRSVILSALLPSEQTIMYIRNDPFLSVLGAFSLFIVIFVGLLTVALTVLALLRRGIDHLLALVFRSGR